MQGMSYGSKPQLAPGPLFPRWMKTRMCPTDTKKPSHSESELGSRVFFWVNSGCC